MQKAIIAGFVLCSLFWSDTSSADVPEYHVERATGNIVIDGILDDADWASAQSVGDFKFPWLTEGEEEQTEVKMLWDDTFLYVAYKCEDKHIWADHYDTNSQTFRDDCVEMFWNPNPEAGDKYNMFEINCIGNLLSVYNNFERKFQERDSRIMVPHIAQILQGTVNNDNDTDSGWVIEMAVRFSDYPELSKRKTPLAGDLWRVGLNRCGGKTNPQSSQWSPSQTDKPSFHVPKDYGKIIFSDKRVR